MGTGGPLSECYFPGFEHVHDIIDLPKPIRQAAAASREVNVPWMLDTVVPCPFVKTSTRASSCLASASMRLVPNPDFDLSKAPSGLPIPLSETVSFQFVSADHRQRLSDCQPCHWGRRASARLITSSVTMSPMLTAALSTRPYPFRNAPSPRPDVRTSPKGVSPYSKTSNYNYIRDRTINGRDRQSGGGHDRHHPGVF
jgi:hypothetical protein